MENALDSSVPPRSSRQGSEPHREERDMRSTVLSAAVTLFAARGYNATSVRDIVEAAGCTKPTLYYYFKNKEQLFIEALRACTDTITRVVTTQVRGSGDIRARLSRALSASLRFVDENPALVKLAMMAERQPEEGQPHFDFDSLHRVQLSIARDTLREGVESGVLRADLNIDEAAIALFAMLDYRIGLHIGGKRLPDNYTTEILDLFFKGAGA